MLNYARSIARTLAAERTPRFYARARAPLWHMFIFSRCRSSSARGKRTCVCVCLSASARVCDVSHISEPSMAGDAGGEFPLRAEILTVAFTASECSTLAAPFAKQLNASRRTEIEWPNGMQMSKFWRSCARICACMRLCVCAKVGARAEAYGSYRRARRGASIHIHTHTLTHSERKRNWFSRSRNAVCVCVCMCLSVCQLRAS